MTTIYLLVPYMVDKYINSTFIMKQIFHILISLFVYILCSKFIKYYSYKE